MKYYSRLYRGITDLINVPSLINLDFADVQTVMKDKGIAHIGIGHGKGENKAADAIKMAVESPLLETTIKGATDIILNVTGDVSLYDANEASTYIEELTGDDVNVIFGATENKDMQGQLYNYRNCYWLRAECSELSIQQVKQYRQRLFSEACSHDYQRPNRLHRSQCNSFTESGYSTYQTFPWYSETFRIKKQC